MALFLMKYGVIMMVIIELVSSSHPCEFYRSCRCWNVKNLSHVDCSSLFIDTIPNISSKANFVNLSYNAIENLTAGSFRNLSELLVLDLSQNLLSKLQPGTFIGLKKLKKLILEVNNLQYYPSTFPNGLFKPLSSLVYLDVGSNNLHTESNRFTFPDDVISELTLLESVKIDVISNEEDFIPFGSGFSLLHALRKIKTSFCSFDVLSNKTFSNLPYIKHIDISGCMVKSYMPGAFYSRNLTFLSLASVHIIDLAFFWRFFADFVSFNVETVILTDTLLLLVDFPEPFFYFLYNTGISVLKINKNQFLKVSPPFYLFDKFPETLQSLDFSENKLSEFSYSMPNLLKLNLAHNELGNFLESETYMLSNVTNLTDINISFNNIHDLKFSLFHGHPRLEKINLSNNILSDVSFDISHLRNLKLIDLSSNRISIFNKYTMEIFNNIGSKNNLKIDLSNNVLQCSCKSVSFIKWMADHIGYFVHSEIYKCRFENGTVVVTRHFTEMASQLHKDCQTYTVLITSTVVSILVAVIVMSLGLAYRYRWRLRYLYYMTRAKYKKYKPIETRTKFAYNAFISYSDEEKDFIIRQWIPNIEQDGNFKLCIHQRDFLPGEDITDNITNGIHESNKTICIITRSFLKSYYCMFEFNMARMESIYSRNGRNILFLVFYERILPRELPLVMLELVQQQSYIEYPNDEQGNVVFWAKIREAIE